MSGKSHTTTTAAHPATHKAQKAPKSPKAVKLGKNGKPIKKHRKRVQTFSTYIHAVKDQVKPENKISRKTVPMINSLLTHILHKFIDEAYALTSASSKTKSGRDKIRTRTFQLAMRQILTGDLAKTANSEGMKAVRKYEASFA